MNKEEKKYRKMHIFLLACIWMSIDTIFAAIVFKGIIALGFIDAWSAIFYGIMMLIVFFMAWYAQKKLLKEARR